MPIVSIYDKFGNLVRETQLSGTKFSYNVQVTGLPRGLYTCRVRVGNATRFVGRVLIEGQ